MSDRRLTVSNPEPPGSSSWIVTIGLWIIGTLWVLSLVSLFGEKFGLFALLLFIALTALLWRQTNERANNNGEEKAP